MTNAIVMIQVEIRLQHGQRIGILQDQQIDLQLQRGGRVVLQRIKLKQV